MSHFSTVEVYAPLPEVMSVLRRGRYGRKLTQTGEIYRTKVGRTGITVFASDDDARAVVNVCGPSAGILASIVYKDLAAALPYWVRQTDRGAGPT